ncbi:DUF2461 domain-containing protein [Maribacter halichondriae]|uniref:DUF2461 domain-containing protein n=1 Tax=Maribacter halichondriae TaxID=2980554 RepID=UPI0023590C84|nr:DUF2461 domain-containing protein [Maribacter sp. Hal144]
MITKAYSSFFKELSKNNHKEWFQANKKRYEIDVKEPFMQLLEDLLPPLREWDDRILPNPKKAVFRINRDIRFAKDKSPYNTIMKAGFSAEGKKSIYPGYYLGIDGENIHVCGGLFMIRPPELKKVREHIAKNPEKLVSIITEKDFTHNFGKLKGDKAKRIDKSFLPVAEKTDRSTTNNFMLLRNFPWLLITTRNR